MARIETWLECDLMKPTPVLYPRGPLFTDDNEGNLIGVHVTRDGSPVSLSGSSATGYCVLASGTVVPTPGTISGNDVTILLPSAAYSVPGLINIIIKLTQGTAITTIGAVISTVYGMGNVIEPSQSTIDAWTAQINAAIALVEGYSVRYDVNQNLTDVQKTRAKNNIGAIPSAVSVGDNNYKLILP